MADGSLAIVDYKTGTPPSAKAVADGYSMQLGLLGLIAERGGFDGIEGAAACFEYWVAGARRAGALGYVEEPGGRAAAGSMPRISPRWPNAISPRPRRAG